MIRNPFGGPDAIRFDTRPFTISPAELEHLCTLFCIGTPRQWEREKGQQLSHTSFMLYLESSRGRYILKFHTPQGKGISTAVQEAMRAGHLSRLLMAKGFPAPRMHVTKKGQYYVMSHGAVATCQDFLEGHPAYQRSLTPRRIGKINASILSLDQALRTIPDISRLVNTIPLPMKLRRLVSADGKDKYVRQAINRLHQTYARSPHLFAMQPVHANLSLANIFFHKDQAYILDLGHIQTDQELAGLATLTASCMLLKTPPAAIQTLVHGYFKRHRVEKEKMPVLGSLVQMELAKEYVKTKHRQENLSKQELEGRLKKEYLNQLNARLRMLKDRLAKPAY